MAKKIEMYEGRPVFQASDSKQLKKAVAKYKGEVTPPYVVRVPDETVSVCSRAFSANKDIGVVILPDSVWSIGDEAFCSCKNLTSIILPESPELTIGYWAFAGCSSLSDISIPSSVRRIKRHAFEYCNNLTKITIPASVWEIGAEAFGSCERLAEVTFLCLVEDVEEIDKDCLFECSNLNKIIVPYKQGIAYKKMLPEELHALIVEQSRPATSDTKEDWEEGEEEDMANEIEMYEGRPVFRASDSRQLKRAVAQYEGDVRPPYVVRVPDKTKYLQPRTFWENKDIGVVILPDSVWSIDHGVFLDCKKLTSIILPKSLELIDEVAFSGCSSLSDISIPSSVCMIGDGAFESCNKLTKITIPASVFRIEHGAFWYCRRLTEVTFLGLVDKLAENCFKACPNLTKIIVPYKQGIAYKKMLPEELHALIVEQSGSATSDIKEDRDEGEEEDMASEIEMYEGRPVFRASNSKQLADAVAKYEGEVAPPYVVRVPDKTKYIEERAFRKNKDIGVVILPDSVWIIDETAFCVCKNLTSINLPESLELIDEFAFAGCSSLSDISIPSSVRRIHDKAFCRCISLTKITIPASVFKIGKAFILCRKLTEVTFLGLVEEIDKDCFLGCINLTKIIVPDKKGKAYKKMLPEELHALIVEQSESATFDAKKDLAEAEDKKDEMCEVRPVFQASDSKQLADAVAKYEGDVAPPYVVRIPDKTRYVKRSAFQENKDIGVVILPDSICYIDRGAFKDCENLTSINLPESLELIDEFAFAGCSSLSDISIPSSVFKIGCGAFYHCDSLTKITIPASVFKIEGAFRKCKKLTEVTFLGLVEEIDEYCFEESYNLTKIIVPYKQGKAYMEKLNEGVHDLIVEQSGSATFDTKEDWSEDEGEEEDMASEIEMYEGRPVFQASNTEQLKKAVARYEADVEPPYVVRIPDKTRYVKTVAFRYYYVDIGVVFLPDSVCSIEYEAFMSLNNLTSIILPESLKVIEGHAFDGCSSLSDISIPSSVCMIGDGAFESCNKLTKITIPASVFKIGSAFRECEKLTEVTFLGLVEEMNEYCFEECINLTKIIVPDEQRKAYKKMLPKKLHALIVEQSESATFDTKEDLGRK